MAKNAKNKAFVTQNCLFSMVFDCQKIFTENKAYFRLPKFDLFNGFFPKKIRGMFFLSKIRIFIFSGKPQRTIKIINFNSKIKFIIFNGADFLKKATQEILAQMSNNELKISVVQLSSKKCHPRQIGHTNIKLFNKYEVIESKTNRTNIQIENILIQGG
jgi:hypothetical protein